MHLGIPRVDNRSDTSRNFFALVFGIGSQFFIQMLTIPLFLHYLTIQQYAVWVVSINLAQLANFSDLGTITASQNYFPYLKNQGKFNEITKRISQGINLNTFNISNTGNISCTGTIDCGGISLSGVNANYNIGYVDSGNYSNTYLTLKANVSNNDWCYFRQIGSDNAFKLALDFHDDGNVEMYNQQLHQIQ